MPGPSEPANGATSADPSERALDTLLELIKAANAPEIREAQTLLLRRLALQGDVIPSRIPPPKNITEIGGYLNLLETLGQQEMRAQMLSGILGVSGPNPPLGWTTKTPPVSVISITNDRPQGPAQPTIPLTVAIRSDYAPALQAALGALHGKGAALPMLSSMKLLPPAQPGVDPPADVLPYLGRVLEIVPPAALRDAQNDPIALARPQGSVAGYEIVARSLSAGAPLVPAQPWEAIQCTDTACAPVNVTASFVPIGPFLAAAGFYPLVPLPAPTSLASVTWARLTNVTGLIAGVTRLGDELSLLYGGADVQASAFAPRVGWVWNGATFAPL